MSTTAERVTGESTRGLPKKIYATPVIFLVCKDEANALIQDILQLLITNRAHTFRVTVDSGEVKIALLVNSYWQLKKTANQEVAESLYEILLSRAGISDAVERRAFKQSELDLFIACERGRRAEFSVVAIPSNSSAFPELFLALKQPI